MSVVEGLIQSSPTKNEKFMVLPYFTKREDYQFLSTPREIMDEGHAELGDDIVRMRPLKQGNHTSCHPHA